MTKSIESRLIIVFALLVLVVMFVSDFFIIDRVRNYYFDELKKRIEYNITSSIVKVLQNRNLSNDKIQEIADNTIKESPYGFNVDKLIITDIQGRVIASFPRMDTPFFPSDYILNALSGMKASVVDTSKQKLILCYPVSDDDGIFRTLYIEMSTQNVSKTIEDIKNILITAHIITLFVAMILGFLFARTLSTPIKLLTKKAIQISKGDFEQNINVLSEDEIGKLAIAFNEMTKNLKENILSLRTEKEKMEKILENMNDGLIAIGSKGDIVHINKTAEKYIEKPLDEFIEMLRNNQSNIIESNNKILDVTDTPFIDSEGKEGKIYILHDITEQFNLDKMRKEFVANVSHELRTPITTIKSYSETLLSVDDNEIKNQFLGVVINECDRMTRLVSDLLYLSKIDAGENMFKFEDVSLKDIVLSVCDKLRLHAQKKNQEIISNDIIDIVCNVDRDKIEQVVTNIVSNAIKYIQEGGRIEVSIKDEGELACVIVKDNGPGIPQDDLPKIFDRFYRVDKARSRELGGSGLGLSIAYEIVKKHNGNIKVESSIGEGTTFYICLPTKKQM